MQKRLVIEHTNEQLLKAMYYTSQWSFDTCGV
jgi:hypothetical protein